MGRGKRAFFLARPESRIMLIFIFKTGSVGDYGVYDSR